MSLFLRIAVATAGLTFGLAHAGQCVNESKPDGAGNHTTVVVDGTTGEVVSVDTNPGGQIRGGFADVEVDTDGDGDGDVTAIEDTFIVGNHSQNQPPGQDIDGAEESVLPAVHDGGDPAGEGQGVGHAGH